MASTHAYAAATAGRCLDKSLLREYDIRGVVGETLTEPDAYAIGRAYGAMLTAEGGTTTAVGYDGRESAPLLAEALTLGLIESGVDVLSVGLAATPTLYFAVHALEADGGVMVTGSHNPPDYNGFKLMLGRRTLHGDDIQALGRTAAGGGFVEGVGRVRQASVADRHVARIVADHDFGHAMKVVWDPGHGAAAGLLPALTASLPGEHVLINCDVDARFPAHHPDPSRAQNLVQLQQEVRRTGANIGFAFDGDGDRVGVVDVVGGILWPDQMLAFFARDMLADRPGATIIADVKASQTVFDAVRAAGGAPVMWRTGHSLIKAKMAEIGALLAGDMSGHFFFADRYYGFDDGLYAAVRALSILSSAGASLADFRHGLPKVLNTPEIRLECPEARKCAVVEEVAERLREARADFSAVDGVRVAMSDGGWWLLRASNTENVLAARCEAWTEEGLDAALAALAAQLEASGLRLSLESLAPAPR